MTHQWKAMCAFYALLALSLAPPPAHSATVKERCAWVKELEFDASDITNRAYSSPIATYRDNLYFTYVDPDLSMIIVKKTPDGSISSNQIMARMTNDTHNGPSLGIDSRGYIHVVGNMHNDTWQYWVSDHSEDISSFTFIGEGQPRSIPGTGISYPYFVTDNDLVLYSAYRHIVAPGSGIPGTRAAGISRYDVRSGSWTPLGGSDYVHKIITVFWNNTGASQRLEQPEGAYQPYQPRIAFDRTNGMHVSMVVADSTATNIDAVPKFTHVIYAFSDDGGRSFRRADGSVISPLPITLESADVVVGPDLADMLGGYSYRSAVGVTSNGRPIVKIPTEGTSLISGWTLGMGWSKPTKYPSAYRAQFVTDGNGVITSIANGLSRSHDDGETWSTCSNSDLSGYATTFDRSYLFRSELVRFSDLASDGIVTVWTVRFSAAVKEAVDDIPQSKQDLR